jgi:hypothetical protein
VCFGAGVVVTWVRFEALASVGTHGLLAADRSELFTTGAFALFGVALRTATIVGLVALGAALALRLQRARSEDTRAIRGARALGHPARAVWHFGERHGWVVHVLIPLALFVGATWLLPEVFGAPLPMAVRVVIAVVLTVLLWIGAIRVLARVGESVATGKSAFARRMRWPTAIFAGLAFVLAFNSWNAMLALIIGLGFVPHALRLAREHPEYVDASFWSVLDNERKTFAALIIAISIGAAIAAEADQPSGLSAVYVTPVSGPEFNAIALGERHGLIRFLKITPEARIVPHGEIGLTPGQIKSIEFTYTLTAPRNDRIFAVRLWDWLSRPQPRLRN